MPRSFILISCFLLSSILAGCHSSGIPCPKIGGKQKFTLFKKKPDPAKPNEAGFGQSQRTSYGKDGLMKKKTYKSASPKPRRLKSV